MQEETVNKRKKIRFEYTTIIVVFTLSLIGFFTFKLYCSIKRHYDLIAIQENYSGCYHSMSLIDDAVVRYSRKNKGKYPKSLAELVPQYLEKIPRCPCAGRDTYSDTYKMVENPGVYFFCCEGKNHTGPENTPQVVSELSFYPDRKDYDPVLFLCENGNMPQVMDGLAEISADLKSYRYIDAVSSIDSLLKLQVERRETLYMTKAYCLFKQKNSEEALNCMKSALAIKFRAGDWERIFPFIDNIDYRWKASDMLLSYVDSKDGDLEAILFLLKLQQASFDAKTLDRLCRLGLELSLEQKESLLPEFYFRGKLLLLSGNRDRALSFFLAAREFSSGGDFVDSVVTSLSEKEVAKLNSGNKS